MRPLAIAAMSIAMLAPAKAGDNSCLGVVTVGKEWSMIEVADIEIAFEGKRYVQPGYKCRFLTASKIGRQILSKCPNGSSCSVSMPLPRGGMPDLGPPIPRDEIPDHAPLVFTIKQILSVERD